MLFDELLGGEHGAGHAFDRGREDEFRAVAFEQPAPFERHVFGHGEDEPVALDGADERKADAGVPGRRLDDGGARLEAAVALGVLDHREGDAVLDAAARVQALELAEHGGAAFGGRCG